MNSLDKGLYIVSTPIGNLSDISFRAKDILSIVDFIICENPLHSMKLLNNLGIKKKLYSLHDYNENILIKRIEKYQLNSSIALISDSGSPLISDPGYKLVLDYIKKKLMVTVIPGPSSIISSLQLSGLPINNFEFFGFVPKNTHGIKSLISKIEDVTSTSVFFISGKRLLEFLKNIDDMKINRTIAVCKEITKKNEFVFRGDSKKIINEISSDTNNLRGEFVVIVAGKNKEVGGEINLEVKLQINKLLEKFSLTEVVEIVHNLTKLSKKKIYSATLLLKNESKNS